MLFDLLLNPVWGEVWAIERRDRVLPVALTVTRERTIEGSL